MQLMQLIFLTIFTETALECLDDCIKWSKDMKRIKFNYKYLEDREKDAHHVLKLIHDKVCWLNIIVKFHMYTKMYSFITLIRTQSSYAIIHYIFIGQFKSTTAPCCQESDKLEVDELSFFYLHHKHGGVFGVYQSPDCICFGSTQPSARCL